MDELVKEKMMIHPESVNIVSITHDRRITMSQSTTLLDPQFSSSASLAGLVAHLRARGVLDDLRQGVHIRQKTVKDRPQDKLLDILLVLLAGAQSLVQLNTLLRDDAAVQQAAGRTRCAEQSVAQQTLDAATAENVTELQQVLTTLIQRHSQVAHHSFRAAWLLLDVDLTGLPAGKQAEQSVKGYFSEPGSRRGRQQGRVLASQYDEIVCDALYPGNTLLVQVLPELIEQAEQVLGLNSFRRRRTIVRFDGGGGGVERINWLLERGYALVGKEYSARRARLLADRVTEWVSDSTQPDRQMGWVPQESSEYVRPVRRLAVRSKSAKGQWHYAVLLFAGLSDWDVLTLMGQSPTTEATSIRRAFLHFYDQRGGGIESSFGQDKSGLGLTKRNKKRFQAQRLLMLLGTLAHNLLMWSRRWLAQCSPEQAARLQQYGIKRMIRDLAHIRGRAFFDVHGRLQRIALSSASSLSRLMLVPLRQLLAPSSIDVILDET
ncbi:MAG TPA: transposase [Ktedonobacteraceae bacterium]|nr:transposase [Ktedonobacteraceae bacterium]